MSHSSAVTMERTTTRRNPYLDRFLDETEKFGPFDEFGFSIHSGDYDEYSESMAADVAIYRARKYLVKHFAWAVPNDEAINLLVAHGPIVEMGAGAGYWARLVEESGGDIVAFDGRPVDKAENGYHDGTSWFDVSLGGPETLAQWPTRALLLCWPSAGTSFAKECLESYTGDTLIYVGEEASGCTANDEFFEVLARDWVARECVHIPQWPHMSDYLQVYSRNAL